MAAALALFFAASASCAAYAFSKAKALAAACFCSVRFFFTTSPFFTSASICALVEANCSAAALETIDDVLFIAVCFDISPSIFV